MLVENPACYFIIVQLKRITQQYVLPPRQHASIRRGEVRKINYRRQRGTKSFVYSDICELLTKTLQRRTVLPSRLRRMGKGLRREHQPYAAAILSERHRLRQVRVRRHPTTPEPYQLNTQDRHTKRKGRSTGIQHSFMRTVTFIL